MSYLCRHQNRKDMIYHKVFGMASLKKFLGKYKAMGFKLVRREPKRAVVSKLFDGNKEETKITLFIH